MLMHVFIYIYIYTHVLAYVRHINIDEKTSHTHTSCRFLSLGNAAPEQGACMSSGGSSSMPCHDGRRLFVRLYVCVRVGPCVCVRGGNR